MKKISLCMIVKNESHVIERCLESVKPLIDFVLIQDTGSTDNTIDVIVNWLNKNGIDGTVFSEEWINFAHNRSLSLLKLHEKSYIDYALMIDADEIIIYNDDFNPYEFKSQMDADVYDICTKMGSTTYLRPQISSNKKHFRYEGVVHEFLTGEITTRKSVEGFYNQPIQDSYRNKTGNKFEKDVVLLKKAIEETQDLWFKSRYTFYLAQSLRDLQKREESLEYYLKRGEMGFWNEEIFVSYLNAAILMRELNYPHSEIIFTYMKGHESCPTRAECIHGLIQYCRIHGFFNLGYILGRQGISIGKPQNALFSDEWIYDYGITDEFSILCYYSGNFLESKQNCEKLLHENKIPTHYIDRIQGNLKFAVDKLKFSDIQ